MLKNTKTRREQFSYEFISCLFGSTDSMMDEFFILNMSGAGLGLFFRTETMPAGKLIIMSPMSRTWHCSSSAPLKQAWHTS